MLTARSIYRVFLLRSVFALVAACFCFGGSVQADIREVGIFNLQPGFSLTGQGLLETIIFELDETNQTLKAQAVISPENGKPLPKGFFMVLNSGGAPAEQGVYAVIFIDAVDSNNPRILVSTYNPADPLNSMFDGSVQPGIQPGDIIFEGDASIPEVLSLSSTVTDGKRTLDFLIDTSTINSHIPLYPSVNQVSWEGLKSSGAVGIWFYVFSEFSAQYDSFGHLTSYDFEEMGGIDAALIGFPYKPECAANITSTASVNSVSNEFIVGETVSLEGLCVLPESGEAKISYSALPSGSTASFPSGATISDQDKVEFQISTLAVAPGDAVHVDFSCAGTIYGLPPTECQVDLRVRQVECVQADNTALLAELDGFGKRLDSLNTVTARRAKKRGTKDRARIRALLADSKVEALNAWSIWESIPTVTQSCEAGPLVSVSELGTGRQNYIDAVGSLERIGDSLTKILRRTGARKLSRRLKRSISTLAALAIETAEETPLSTSTLP